MAAQTVSIGQGHTLPAITSIWRNYPSMNAACHQGSSTTTILDPTRYAELADKDLVILQGFYPSESRKQSRKAGIDAVHAINPGTKFLLYVILQETTKVLFTPAGNDPFEISCALIADAVKGNPNWIVHRVNQIGAAGRVECNFDPTNKWECNMAALVAGLNSLHENYPQAFWKDLFQLLSTGTDITDLLFGVFVDNFNGRPPTMFQNNGGTTITDQDYNQSGTIDGRADYSGGVNAGGSMWTAGHLEAIAKFYSQFGSDKLLVPNAARFLLDYTDGLGTPPLPVFNHPYYRKLDVTMPESTNLGLGLQIGASSYTFNGGGSTSAWMRLYEHNERMLLPDALNTRTGKGAVLMHALCVNRATPTVDDYTYARFICALSMLVERAAMCVMQGAALPLSLDETLIELGVPLTTRSMGTYNESTATFSLKAADQSVGVARFHYVKYPLGIVVARVDSPTIGVYPSADAAVTFTFPTPPVGWKYQRFNAATYQHPTTLRTTRGQDTTLNSGADITSLAMKPYTGFFGRLVPA